MTPEGSCQQKRPTAMRKSFLHPWVMTPLPPNSDIEGVHKQIARPTIYTSHLTSHGGWHTRPRGSSTHCAWKMIFTRLG
jgi:hypothetical protein